MEKVKIFIKRSYGGKMLKKNAFQAANDQSLDRYQTGLASIVYKFFV